MKQVTLCIWPSATDGSNSNMRVTDLMVQIRSLDRTERELSDDTYFLLAGIVPTKIRYSPMKVYKYLQERR